MKTFDSPKHKISMNIRFFTQSVAIVLIALLTTSFARGQVIGVITPNPIDGTVSNSVTFNLSGFGTNIPIIAGVIVGSTYTSFPIASASSTAVTINIGANALSNGAYDVFAFSFGTGMVQTAGAPFAVGPPPPAFNPGFVSIAPPFNTDLSNTVTLTVANPVIDGGVQVIMVRNPGAVPPFNAAQSAPFAVTITPSAFTPNTVTFSMPLDLRHVGTNANTSANYDIYLQKGSQIALVIPSQPITHSAIAFPAITSFSPTTAPQGGTVTITGIYLSRGIAPPPTVEFLDLSGNPLSPAVTTAATVTRANGTQATFTIPNTLPVGLYKLRYIYENPANNPITSLPSSGILAVTAVLPQCASPTLSFTPPSAIYLGTVISGTATNATNVTANIGGQSLSNTGTATNFSFTVTNQTYTTAALSVTAIRDVPGVCSPSSSAPIIGGPVLPSTFVGLPTPVTLPVSAGGTVTVSGNGLMGSFSLVPSTVANPSVDLTQDIAITAITANGGTSPAVLNIPSTVPAGSYRVRLINLRNPAPGILTPTAFITIGSVPPVITSVSPSLITPTTGNLTITGNNFLGATAVAFGISSNPSSFVTIGPSLFNVVNNTTITVPISSIPLFNGARNVRVTTPSGTTTSTATVSRPNMTFSPSFASRNTSATANNGTIITINSSNLQGLNTNYRVEFQTSAPGVWTPGVAGVLSGGVPNPSLSVNAAGTVAYVRAPHNAVTGKIRLFSLISNSVIAISANNINLIGTTPANWLSVEEENNGGETDNVQTIGDATSSVTLFPNPATDAVSVTTEGFTGEVTVALMDMTGALLETKSVASGTDAQFNLANRQRGVYVVRLTDETGHTELRRLVKE